MQSFRSREAIASGERGLERRRDRSLECIVLVVLYLLQMVNAELLRRAIGSNPL